MWVECVNANRMRDGNFWSLDDRKHPALTLLDLLKFVLSLRRLATSFLICLVGNGIPILPWLLLLAIRMAGDEEEQEN
ncbi:hypothetical protein F2Q69_00011687 [Brassica cretica]|uniref:Uncharacterized protein n=2 Tax=Brassica cretica TaxID=69181 RepID=A0ABQ7DHV0_BRACR|nr:hypothetical protein F2Q69_00011687 [Brassica cretica]KAF3577567.1 hypothetical protein DY000_02029990 [Brassica cretica]